MVMPCMKAEPHQSVADSALGNIVQRARFAGKIFYLALCVAGESSSDAAEPQQPGSEAPGKTVRFNSNELVCPRVLTAADCGLTIGRAHVLACKGVQQLVCRVLCIKSRHLHAHRGRGHQPSRI